MYEKLAGSAFLLSPVLPLQYEYTTSTHSSSFFFSSKMQCVSLSLVSAVLSLVAVVHDDTLFALLLCFAQAKLVFTLSVKDNYTQKK
jgi:hypothetical protein